MLILIKSANEHQSLRIFIKTEKAKKNDRVEKFLYGHFVHRANFW